MSYTKKTWNGSYHGAAAAAASETAKTTTATHSHNHCSADDTSDRAKNWRDWYIERFEEIPLKIAISAYISYAIYIFWGHVYEFFRRLGLWHEPIKVPQNCKDFVPLYHDWEAFYTRHLYRRVRDCWNRPIASSPNSEMTIMERITNNCGWTFFQTGRRKRVINMGSYNYLGFAKNIRCEKAVQKSIEDQAIAMCGSRQELGSHKLHRELEELVARFVGQEDAITFQMGFATNALNIPALVDKHCCIISDEYNHSSIVLGARLSGAKISVFKHNDMQSLEHVLQEAVVHGHPRTHRPFKKIVILVEGIYSMEGTIVKLPEIIRLKKKYKAYLYLDEAHSIGAIGSHGRGVVDYFGCDFRDVDVMMGTFTKSFGSAGGYIAGSKKLIGFLRVQSHAASYGSSMPPLIAQQIISSMRIILGDDGTNEGKRKVDQLAWNTRYFRTRLYQKGYMIYGSIDSPVVPFIMAVPSIFVGFSREMLKRNIGVVVVGFPAVKLTEARSRFCISAAHTKEQLDEVLNAIDEIAPLYGLQFSRMPPPKVTERDPNFYAAYLSYVQGEDTSMDSETSSCTVKKFDDAYSLRSPIDNQYFDDSDCLPDENGNVKGRKDVERKRQ